MNNPRASKLGCGSPQPIHSSKIERYFQSRVVTISAMTTLHEILNADLALPAVERAQIIACLWDNASPEDWIEPSRDWIAEANRRSGAFEAGEMNGSPWADVRARARRKAGLDG
jgi:putative addiction module component (TIGR02574 family)